jgi:DNA-damage-inducible protein J
MLHIRVDDDTKEQATLALKVPNAETRAAMEESHAMMAARRARFATADELFADLEKTAARKPAAPSRAADYTKAFFKKQVG